MRCGSSKTGINRVGVTTGTRNLADISAALVTIKNGERSTQNPIVVYEKHHHKVCILPWGQIHFINGDKTDIRIKNMMLLIRGGSALLLKPRIPKDRRCVTCGSPEGHGDWSKTEDGYVCSLCYRGSAS
jgi:hypothetical protein